jgi:tRNA(adenine34) deaminase
MNINFFMDKAIEQANKALLVNEIPVGAVLFDNNSRQIIASGHNLVNNLNNATFHAEIIVINKGCKKKKKKYLSDTSLFVTLEPCAMCAAAISEAQIKRIYFGAYDEKKGSLETIMRIYSKKHYFVPEVYGGIREEKCSSLLKNFFQLQRTR